MQKLVHFSFLVLNTTVGGRERVEMLTGQKTVSEATEGELHDESQRGFWITHKDTRGEGKKKHLETWSWSIHQHTDQINSFRTASVFFFKKGRVGGRKEEEDAQNPITLIHKENADEEEKTYGGEKHQVRWNQDRGRETDRWRQEREGTPPLLHRSGRKNLKWEQASWDWGRRTPVEERH